MSLSDWTQYTSGTPIVTISTTSPVVALASLKLDIGDADLVSLMNNNYTLGLTKGKIRSLFRIDAWGGGSTYRCGFSFMHSAANVTGSGQACYLAGLESTNSTSNTHVVLKICTNGLDNGGTTLFTGTNFSRTHGTTLIAFEVEWAYEPSALGGVRIVLREGHGVLTDFSNLALVGQYVHFPGHAVSPRTTSAGEGLFASGLPAFGAGLDIKVDRTSIIGLT